MVDHTTSSNTHAMKMIQVGVPLTIVQQIFGHSNLNTTAECPVPRSKELCRAISGMVKVIMKDQWLPQWLPTDRSSFLLWQACNCCRLQEIVKPGQVDPVRKPRLQSGCFALRHGVGIDKLRVVVAGRTENPVQLSQTYF
jgi:hypothetical protein